MAKITWLGEDNLHGNRDAGGLGGPSFTTAFGGIKFPKGKPIEVTDKDTIARAKRNPFFEVGDADDDSDAPKRGPGRPPRVKADDGDKD